VINIFIGVQSPRVVWACRCHSVSCFLSFWSIWSIVARRQFCCSILFKQESNRTARPITILPRRYSGLSFKELSWPLTWRAIVEALQYLVYQLDTTFAVRYRWDLLARCFCWHVWFCIESSSFSFLRLLDMSSNEAHTLYSAPLIKRRLSTIKEEAKMIELAPYSLSVLNFSWPHFIHSAYHLVIQHFLPTSLSTLSVFMGYTIYILLRVNQTSFRYRQTPGTSHVCHVPIWNGLSRQHWPHPLPCIPPNEFFSRGKHNFLTVLWSRSRCMACLLSYRTRRSHVGFSRHDYVDLRPLVLRVTLRWTNYLHQQWRSQTQRDLYMTPLSSLASIHYFKSSKLASTAYWYTSRWPVWWIWWRNTWYIVNISTCD